jgi:hypothetical protein
MVVPFASPQMSASTSENSATFLSKIVSTEHLWLVYRVVALNVPKTAHEEVGRRKMTRGNGVARDAVQQTLPPRAYNTVSAVLPS